MIKTCTKCKEKKSFDSFKRHKGRKDGFYNQCKECVSKYRKIPETRNRDRETSKIWRKNNPERVKASAKKFRESESGKIAILDWQLKIRYGIPIDKFNEMFNNQKGCCAICGIHQSMLKKRLGVDHSHKTGEIRELLCNPCNTSLGNFNEDIELIHKAIEYLEKHQ